MADEMIKEKIYCMPCMNDNGNNNTQLLAELMNAKNQGTDAATMAALFSKNNQQNAWDNPFIWLIWLAWMGNGGLFGNRADVAQNADLSRQVAQLQDSVNTNHANDIALQAINGNANAIHELSTMLNTDFNTMSTAVCGVKSAIEQVGGQVGYSAESIKNAIALGDSNIMSKMQDCCCQQKQLIIEGNYQNQLATERQTNVLSSQMAAQHSADQLQDCQNHGSLMSRIDQLANGIQSGFAQIGFNQQQNTQAIISNQTQNTQRILDQMCANQTQALRDVIAEKDRQLQSASIVAALKANGCGCAC